MKTITFIRHGKPVIWNQFSPFSMIKSDQIRDILLMYDHCDIENKVENIDKIKNLIKHGDLFISSNLKRAKESFQLLGITDYQVNRLFNEPKLPANIFKRTLNLPMFIWAFLLRVFWLLGHDRECESIGQFKQRMDQAIIYLERKLTDYKNIIVMGHGFVNFFIIRKLRKKGWYKIENKTLKKFWSYTRLAKKIEMDRPL